MNAPESPVVSVGRQDWSFRRRGKIDEARHNQKVKEAIKDDLPTIISDGNIVTADPKSKKIIRVPLKSLELPHIKHKDGNGGVGAGMPGANPGDVIGTEPANGPGKGKEAGSEPGVEYYEAELTVDEITQLVFADLGLPNLRPRKKEQIASEVFVFDDIRKKKSPNNLDIARTIYASMERNARDHGSADFDVIIPEDYRVRMWREDVKEQSSAVVMAMADISGSMGDFEKYITRAFCTWTVGFLRHNYPKVDIVFIAHDTQAQEVTEEQFFSRGTGGGTMCSSANELALNLMERRYSPEQYNIYPLHFSDGDNWHDDDQKCVTLVNTMLDRNISQYAFVQINRRKSSLFDNYEKSIHDERFNAVVIESKEDVLPALKKVFPVDTASS